MVPANVIDLLEIVVLASLGYLLLFSGEQPAPEATVAQQLDPVMGGRRVFAHDTEAEPCNPDEHKEQHTWRFGRVGVVVQQRDGRWLASVSHRLTECTRSVYAATHSGSMVLIGRSRRDLCFPEAGTAVVELLPELCARQLCHETGERYKRELGRFLPMMRLCHHHHNMFCEPAPSSLESARR